MSRTPEAVRQLTNPQKQYFTLMEIKIVIHSRFSKGILRHSNAYIFRLVFYIIGDQNMIE